MKPGGHVVVAAAARLYAPLLGLFALTLFVTRAPGSGVGFLAGLVFGLALALHALAFGAGASRAAFPPSVAHTGLSAGVLTVLLGAASPGLGFAAQLAEAGLFLATGSAAALILAVLVGRAPTLPDGEW